MAELRMPTLGADMTEGRLLDWQVKPGDVVHRGDIVATVDTDKAEIEIETFDDGVIDALLVEPGTKVPVGTVLATIRATADESAAATAPPARPASPEAQAAPQEPAASAPTPPPAAPPAPTPPSVAPASRSAAAAPPASHPRRSSPLARRMAEANGIDLASVRGSGPGGAIVQDDIAGAIDARTAPPAAALAAGLQGPPSAASADDPDMLRRSAAERQASLRKAVADLMTRSKREIPHFGLERTIDLTITTAWLQRYNRERSAADRILPAAPLLKAVALATHDVPELNGTYEDGRLTPAAGVVLGVAVSLRGGGTIAPAIPRADELSLAELMRALREVAVRARRGVLRGTDMAGATLTVTNLGDSGADLVHGVIFPPQVALVGFGRIAPRPVAVDGLLGVRPTVIATLAADHRVTDGHRGSLFLAAIDHHLQEPESL